MPPKENRRALVTANAGKGNLHMRRLTVARDDDNCSDRAPARTRNITCEVCGRAIVHTSGRRPQVCSTRCRNRKNGRRRVRKAFLGRDTGAPAKRQKRIIKSMPCKGQKCCRTGVFSPPPTFSPSKCSTALGHPRSVPVASRLKSAACGNARWWRHEHGARGGGRHVNQIYFFRCFQQ